MEDFDTHLPEDLKEGLIKKFKMDTSDGFNNDVMNRIYEIREKRRIFRYVCFIVISSVLILSVILFTGNYNNGQGLVQNRHVLFNIFQKVVFLMKLGFIPFIIFSVSTTILVDMLFKRLINPEYI